MKKIALTLILSLHISFLTAQLTVRNTSPEPKKETPKAQYDTLNNIEFKADGNYSKYIGQKILFYSRNENSKLTVNYYSNFYLIRPDTLWEKIPKKIFKKLKQNKAEETEKDRYIIDRYKGKYITNERIFMQKPLMYKMDTIRSGYYTPFNEIEGKEFQIINIEHEYPKNDYNQLKFSLLSKDNDSLIWMINEPDKYWRSPAIIVSFYEKINKSFRGKTFATRNLCCNQEFWATNLDTGDKHAEIKGQLKCIDLSLTGAKNEFMTPKLIFEDSVGTKYGIDITKTPLLKDFLIDGYYTLFSNTQNALTINDLTDIEIIKKNLKKVQEEKIANEQKEKEEEIKLAKERNERYNRLQKKYGNRIGRLIIDKKVELGMTKKMCIESWGEPEDINTTAGSYGTHEQWVYGSGNYLYFENGILTTIQN